MACFTDRYYLFWCSITTVVVVVVYYCKDHSCVKKKCMQVIDPWVGWANFAKRVMSGYGRELPFIMGCTATRRFTAERGL